jgi:F-type H+-transporting ATPase subunit epsilon
MPMRVQIVTPEGRVLDVPDAVRVDLPGSEGALGILPGHAPLMTAIDTGELRVFLPNGEERAFAVAGGWAQIDADVVRLLLTFASDCTEEEEASEAACQRAREALERYGEMSLEIKAPLLMRRSKHSRPTF